MPGFTLRSRGSAVPGREAQFEDSSERMVGRDGHVQGWDKKDAMRTLSQMMAGVRSGTITTADAKPVNLTAEARKRQEVVVAAYNDKNGRDWATLGANLAATVTESADREGFMRRILVRNDLQLGQRPMIRVRKKNVTAVLMTTDSMLHPQYVRENWLYPDEFMISVNLRVEHREINQGSGDLLEEKFYEAQEAIMVQEDRRWKVMADAMVGIDHQLKYMVGGLNPTSLMEMRTGLQVLGLTASTALMAADFWGDIVGNPTFANWFDPVTKYEIVTTGELGNLLGLTFITDAFRTETQKVLEPGEMYLLTDPPTHGAYTDRGPVQSNEVNQYPDGTPSRGWYMYEDLSMMITNSKSVIKAVRA